MAEIANLQTPLSWPTDASSTGSHKRSASWGNTEYQKEIVKVKPLQKTKVSQASQACCSPVLGDNATRGTLDSPAACPWASPVVRHRPRRHRSLEDQELEDMFVKDIGDRELLRVLDVPDGHRAPVPQRCASDLSLLSAEFSSLLLPVSPSAPLRLPSNPSRVPAEGTQNITLQSLLDPQDKEGGWSSPVCTAASSPRPNHSYKFQREPPEGCEKVEAYEETLEMLQRPLQLHYPLWLFRNQTIQLLRSQRSPSRDPSLLHYGPDKNKVHFIPTGSAFCPINLVKPLLPNMDFFLRSFPTSGATGSSCQVRGQANCGSSFQDPEACAFGGETPVRRWSPSQATEGSAFHSSLVV